MRSIMKGRPLISRESRFPSGLALAATLLFAQHAAAQQNQPGNPTSSSALQFTPTVKIALIAGGGGLVLIVVLIIVLCCVRRRKKKKKRLPEAQTPVTAGFNPDALPANPAPSQPEPTTATFDAQPPYRSPSDRLPPNPTPFNEYNQSMSPAPPETAYSREYGGSDPYRGASPAPNMAARRGADTPARLRMGHTPHPPSGVGIDGMQSNVRTGGWAAVEQSKAWGMHGRHIDQQGQYYGSISQPAGQGLPPRAMRQVGGGGPPPVRQNVAPAAVYGDDDIYSQRAYAAEHEDERYNSHEMTEPSHENPYRQPAAAGRAQYSPANANPYANPYSSNQDRYAPAPSQQRGYGGGRAGGGHPQQLQVGGYGDYGAGQYGHSRDDSEESDRSYYNYGSQRPTDPNRWV